MSDVENTNADTVMNEEKQEVSFEDYVSKDSQAFEKWIKESESARKYINPMIDSAVSKGINTWKANNLDKIIEEAKEKVKEELKPEKSPLEKRMALLEEEARRAKESERLSRIVSKAASYANDIKLDLGGKIKIEEIAGNDEDRTIDLLDRLKEIQTYWQEAGKKTILRENSSTPQDGDIDSIPYGGDLKKYNDAIASGKDVYDESKYQKIKEFQLRNRRK